jgi:hypothetical protein
MTTKLSIAVVICTLVVARSTYAQRTEHFLDLLPIPRTAGFLAPPEAGSVPIDRQLGPGGVLVTPHGGEPISPFTLAATLLTLDKSGYRSREPFVYEVELRNIGNRPLSFPLSPDSSLFDNRLPDGTLVIIGLADAKNPRSIGETGQVFLYGSASIPGSLETILPGEAMRIRVGSDWMDESRGEERLQVVVRPTLGALSYRDIKSENTITVQALGR